MLTRLSPRPRNIPLANHPHAHPRPRAKSTLRPPARARVCGPANAAYSPRAPSPPSRPHTRSFWSTLTARGPALAGTVAPHRATLLLHTHLPPAAYPPRSASPLWRALALRARASGVLPNFAWAPGEGHALHPGYRGLGEKDEVREGVEGEGEHGEGGGGGGGQVVERYAASVFVAGARAPLLLPEVTLANLDAVEARIARALSEVAAAAAQAQARGPGGASSGRARGGSAPSTSTVGAEREEQGPEHEHGQENEDDKEKAQGVQAQGHKREKERVFLYVCTHGSRDCRCGDGGGAVARALRAEVARKGLEDDVVVGEIAHVGGHKYAANVLVYPSGDWLGTVQESDAPQILEAALAWHAAHDPAHGAGAGAAPPPPLCPPLWRGRMGLGKDAQLALIAEYA